MSESNIPTWQENRSFVLLGKISTPRLNALLRLHLEPINPVVYGMPKKPNLEKSFPLICFQRLSRKSIATQRCRWFDNWYTRDSSLQVLSYYGEILSSFHDHSRLGPTICYFANHIIYRLCSVASCRVAGSAYRYVPILLFVLTQTNKIGTPIFISEQFGLYLSRHFLPRSSI